MTWVAANLTQIGQLLALHLAISAAAIVLSVLIAVPLGRAAHASGRGRGALLAGTGLLYAIPSLPLLIVIPLVSGLPLRSPVTLVVALTIYGIALLARSAADAFGAISDDVLDAAVATGHGRLARFWMVELPLAVPVLIAGIRVVAMSTIGLTTIGALIGIPSLGSLFTDGFQRGIVGEVVAGVVCTVALALLVDALLIRLGRALQPWGNRRIGTQVAA